MLPLTRIVTARLVGAAVSPSFSLGLKSANRIAPISITAIRRDDDDPKYQVGAWPKTREERERAAKKYNLIFEDYEPYDELDGWGDYPKLQPIGDFNRDRYDDFDDKVFRRFYGEPLNLDADMYLWERADPLEHEKLDYPFWLKLSVWIGLFLFVPSLYHAFKYFKIQINNPWKMRAACPDQNLYKFPSQHYD